MCGLPQAFYRDLRLATIIYTGGHRIKKSIYIVHENFSKILALKGRIRNFLNVVAAHIEGI
jgi:hypothetical protein